jgi:hypothetical protein
MARRFVAILLTPIGVLFGAWLGQYVVPSAALDMDFLVNLDGARIGPAPRVPLTAIAFFLPTQLSIPLAIAGYFVVVLFGAPISAYLAKRGRFSFVAAAVLGAIFGAALAQLSAMLLGSVDNLFGPDIAYYGAFVGAMSGLWYWLLAYSKRHAG